MASYTGTSGHDIITGSTGPDYIRGYNGDDQLFGLDGFDTIYGNTGKDRLVGGAGDDNLHGGAGGDDVMEGGTGDDYYQVETPGDRVVELDGEGVDMVDAFGDIILANHVEVLRMRGGTHAIGNDSANRIYTFSDNSRILEGRGGDDQLFASILFTDTLLGGDGDDFLQGSGDDLLDGGAGNDTLFKGGEDAGADILGGEGNDLLMVGDGSNGRFVGDVGDDSYVLQKPLSGATIIEHGAVEVAASDFVL
jgi:Ca2+-binding RTX toxin-like protein